MNKTLLIALGSLLVGLAAGAISWQANTIARLETEGRGKDRVIGEVTAANDALAAVLDEIRETHRKNEELLEGHAARTEAAQREARALERRLREALGHESAFTLDDPLPRAVADALCLRHLAASGHPAGPNQGSASGAADAGEGHTASPRDGAGSGRSATPCGEWRTVTYRDALEWTGLLLDHARLERADKEALRAWSAGREEME